MEKSRSLDAPWLRGSASPAAHSQFSRKPYGPGPVTVTPGDGISHGAPPASQTILRRQGHFLHRLSTESCASLDAVRCCETRRKKPGKRRQERRSV